MESQPNQPSDAMARNYARYPSLVDRTVYITGGADGIGRAMVEQFVAQGAQVTFADINREAAQVTLARCSGKSASLGDAVDGVRLDGPDALHRNAPRHQPVFHHVDLLDIDALQSSIRQTIESLGSLTVLVNNAANDERHSWRDMTRDYWDDRLNTNLRHYFFAIQAAAPAMIEARHGSIINIGSSSYMRKEDVFPGYAIAKAGVEGITRTMAKTFGPDGIRVNTVLPGWVPTERQLERWWTPEGEAQTMAAQAIKRRIYPDEFAQMVLFLAADDGAACTAQHFLVDGGRL